MQVNELFCSVQGEGADVGRLCTFVRFTACNVRCTYCDTAYAFYEGADQTIPDILDAVRAFGAPMVCLTGGEPMLQPDIVQLMKRLLDQDYRVVVETNGVIPLERVPGGVVKIVDVKTPGAFRRADSGPDFATSPRFLKSHFHYPNLGTLTPRDQVKFVLCDREDYEWSLAFVREHRLDERVDEVWLSPSHGQLEPRDLITWMRQDRAPARLNLQIHKYIWSEDTRGV